IAECCDCYVRIIRTLPVFTNRVMPEILSRLSDLAAEVCQIIDRLPVRTLYAPEGTDHDSLFLRRYLEYISNNLDDVELLNFSTETPLRTKLSTAYISLRVAAIRKSTRKIEADIGYRSRPRTVSDSDHFISKEQASGVRVETALSGGSRILV